MKDPDERARTIEAQMTDDERFSLLVAVMGAGDMWPVRDERIPADVPMSAGYVPGVPRLGVPPLLMSDAGLGVTNPATVRATPPPRFRPAWRWPPPSIRRWPAPRAN